MSHFHDLWGSKSHVSHVLIASEILGERERETSRKPTKINNHDKWFDEECKNLRKKLRSLSNQKHREPENLSLRLHYGEWRKQYRNTLWKKKEQQVRNQLNVIEESIESNHFWKNLKTKSNTMSYPKWRCMGKPLLQYFCPHNKEQTAKTYTWSKTNIRINY